MNQIIKLFFILFLTSCIPQQNNTSCAQKMHAPLLYPEHSKTYQNLVDCVCKKCIINDFEKDMCVNVGVVKSKSIEFCFDCKELTNICLEE